MSGNHNPVQWMKLRPAWRAFTLHFAAIAAFLLGPVLNPQAPLTPLIGQIIAAVLLLFIIAKRYGSSYMVGPHDIQANSLNGLAASIKFENISKIEVQQGPIKRFLKYGNIIINSHTGKPIILYGILRPGQIRHIIGQQPASML